MSTKKLFLELLKNNPGKTISGEDAAGMLGVSRNAIWKAANALREEGLELTAASGGGYRLGGSQNLYTAEALQLALEAHGEYPVRLLEETASTNTAAKLWAIEGAPNGALVCAKRQSGGKGRLGRSFQSPEGGLYMSVILRPTQSIANAVHITAAAAVAVCRAVETLLSLQLSIKWVNDLFYKGKKCCGILTEGVTGFESGSIEYLVCGIGLNYTTAQKAFASDVQPIVTSLFPGGSPPVSHAVLAAQIHQNLLHFTQHLELGEFMPEYKQRSMLVGKRVTVLANPPYPALVSGIDDEARLLVQKENGEEAVLSSGEVSVLPD